ncbi:murein hydrolase activator EnvC family protein [Halioxenophilus aromaticivorans]|uniref:Peptidoglycan DD-metalloendopeptidase family protein n=1 Tax=Halioxenophilus aromaticivorans TaxID=1306992 RepID=A0AAV3U4U0_9ALTE
MRKTAIFVVGMLLAGATYGQNADEYEAKLKQLKQAISELQGQLKEVNSAKDQLNSELSKSETAIGDLTQKIQRIEGELAQEKKQLALLREQRDSLQASRKQQATAVAEQLVSAYKLGGQSQLKAILNLDDSYQIARLLRYHQYIVDARQSKIEQYLATVRELDQVEPAIAASAAKLEQQQATLSDQQQTLQSAQKQRKQTLAKLAQESRSAEQRLKQMTSERDELQRLLDEVTTLLADIPTPSDQQPIRELRGKLAWPVEGKIKHRFGTQRAGTDLKWDGVWLAAAAGTPVKALHGGRVVYSDWLRGQGLLLIVDHGAGYLSLYGHNQTLYKEVGDWVKAGETVGLAGDSGGQTEAGLYFEIRHQGKPQNPKRWCRG